jgi:hypothetical protein
LAFINEPIISRMWTSKEARKIEDPRIEEEKTQLVERLLAALESVPSDMGFSIQLRARFLGVR